METSDTRTCPKCGAENAKSRLTCEVCHERLSQWIPKGTENSTKNAKPTEVKKPAKKKEDTETDNGTKKAAVALKTDLSKDVKDTKDKKDSPPPIPDKKIIKRRKRRTPPPSTEPTFFMIEDGKLRAVKVKLVISHPIKSKELGDSDRVLLAFINRNLSILSG